MSRTNLVSPRSSGPAAPRRRAAPPVVVLAVSLLLAATACSSSSGEEGAESGAKAGPEEPTLPLAELYEGQFEAPPTSGPPAVPGKTIWYVSCGQVFAACAVMADAFVDAGEALGWDVVVQDGKADAATAASLVRGAISAKADGVVLNSFDCPSIKTALEEAQAAGIPVANELGADCDNPVYGAKAEAEEPLFTFTATMLGSDDPIEFWRQQQSASADYVVNTVGPDARVLYLSETSYANQPPRLAAFTERIRETCHSCDVKTADWTFAQVPNPATQIWQTAIQANPDRDAIAWALDSILPLGLQSALTRAQTDRQLAGGGESSAEAFDLIREGVVSHSVAVDYAWWPWATADDFNRLFAGEDPADFPDQGNGFQVVDADHNLPPEGERLTPPIDYRAAYRAVWDGE